MLSLFLLAALQGPAPAELVVDLSPVKTPIGSFSAASGPEGQVFGGDHYFAAESQLEGLELWRSDGTAGGTVLVADLYPGPLGSDPRLFTVFQGALHFVATGDPDVGDVVWRTDGTAAGTVPVLDIGPGSGVAWITDLVATPTKLLVIGSTDVSTAGRKLYSGDGSGTAPVPLLDSIWGTTKLHLAPNGSQAYLESSLPSTGSELFITDGTPGGTGLVGEITPGPGHSRPGYFVNLGGQTLFTAYDAALNLGLYATDGTPGGITFLYDLSTEPPWLPNLGTEWQGYFYFPVKTPSGKQVARTDGTPGGTSIAFDPGSAYAASYASNMTDFGSSLAMIVYSSKAHLAFYDGSQLTVLDGDAIVPGFTPNSTAGLLAGSELVFVAKDDLHGYELWRSDGTTAGTQLVSDLEPGPSSSLPATLSPLHGGGVLFGAEHSDIGRELFRYDGTSASLVKDIHVGHSSWGESPSNLLSIEGSQVVFRARISGGPRTLWTWSEQTGAIEHPVDESGQPVHWPDDLTTVYAGGKQATFFTAGPHPGTDRSLYVLDGAKPRRLADLSPGTPANPRSLVAGFGRVFFQGDTAGGGGDLAVSDGTDAGTTSLIDLGGGIADGSRPLGVVGDKVILSGTEVLTGEELYVSDGSVGSASLLADIRTGPASSEPELAFALADLLYFTADDGVHGRELWVTDGTQAGTQMVFDLVPGATSGEPSRFTLDGGTLYFEGQGTTTWSFWRYDFAAPPVELDPITQTSATGPRFVRAGNLLYYADGGSWGHDDLWATDGTPGGAYLVGGTHDGHPIGSPGWITAVGERVYFEGSASGVGTELFVSDGTAAGTTLVADIRPGEDSSSPAYLTLAEGDLYFRAWWFDGGAELVRIPDVGAYVARLEAGAPAVELRASTPTLGQAVTFEGFGVPVSHVSALLLSLPPSAMTGFFTAPGVGSWIQPGSAVVQLLAPSQPGTTVPVPSAPALAGLRMNAQLYHAALPATSAQTSNGLSLVLGP